MNRLLDDAKALVRKMGEAMNSRKLDLLDEILAPDCVRHCQATPNVTMKSLADFKEYLRQDFAVFPDSVQSLTHLVAEGVWLSSGPHTKAHSTVRWDHFLRQREGCSSTLQPCFEWKGEELPKCG